MTKPRNGVMAGSKCIFSASVAFVLVLLIFPGVLRASERDPESPVHHILLLDDSKDVKPNQFVGSYHKKVVVGLPNLLAGGNPSFPFTPIQKGDRVTVVRFAVWGSQDNTFDVAPRKLFRLVSQVDVGDPTVASEKLTKILGDWSQNTVNGINVPKDQLSFRGNLSPVVTALSLAPWVAGQEGWGGQGKRYGSLVLWRLSNEKVNQFTKNSVALELANLKEGAQLINLEQAQLALSQVNRDFHFECPQNARDELLPGPPGPPGRPGRPGLFIQAVQVIPNCPDPEVLVHYHPTVEMDRVAVGPNRLELRSKGGSDEVEVRTDHRLKPLKMAVEGDRPWMVGSHTLASKGTKNFSEKPGTEDGPKMPLRTRPWETLLPENMSPPLTMSASDALPKLGQLRFRMVFAFTGSSSPPVYSQLNLKTSWLEADYSLLPVASLKGGVVPWLDWQLDNSTFASLWLPQDKDGLGQNMAIERLHQKRKDWHWFLGIAAAFILFGVALFLYRSTKVGFRPNLVWQPAPRVEIDFDRPSSGKRLLGTVLVKNTMMPGWVCRLISLVFKGHSDQPSRWSQVLMENPDWKGLGLSCNDGQWLGFLGPALKKGEGEVLVAEAVEPLAHDQKLFVFLSIDHIEDFLPPHGEDATERDLEVDLAFTVKWAAKAFNQKMVENGRLSFSTSSSTLPVKVVLHLIPERPKPPLVELRRDDSQAPHFKLHGLVPLGTVFLTSQARHCFAESFKAAYSLRMERGGLVVPADGWHLESNRLLLPPHCQVTNKAFLRCDNLAVPNPAAGVDLYEFTLEGPFGDGSYRGPFTQKLLRDPSSAEIVLTVKQHETDFRFYWNQGEPWVRLSNCSENKLSKSEFTLPLWTIEFSPARRAERMGLLEIYVENTGAVGEGLVEVTGKSTLLAETSARAQIELEPGANLDQMVNFEAFDKSATLRVKEGEDPKPGWVTFNCIPLTTLNQVSIPAEQLTARLDLAIRVRTDQGEESKRNLTLFMPVELVQEPGDNWICVDFGTSAVAVASGDHRVASLVPLQDIPVVPERGSGTSLQEEHPTNQEAGTPFLPSAVICNSDLRLKNWLNSTEKGTIVEGEESQGFAGYPKYVPYFREPSQRQGQELVEIGRPDFVGLPPIHSQYEGQLERVVFSLKSWLGTASAQVKLATKVQFLHQGEVFTSDRLPADSLVQSGYAALCSAYLERNRSYRDEVVVITHPNTFTRHHCDRLRKAVWQALHLRLNLLDESRLRLVSESEAVAFYYAEKVREDRDCPLRQGRELVLVYDMGAGTLDLSLVALEWQAEHAKMKLKDMEVLASLGVPMAGNEIDRLLATLVDRQLRSLKKKGSGFDYQYPLAARKWGGTAGDRAENIKDHRKVLASFLWELRKAKHQWCAEGCNGSLHVWVGSAITAHVSIISLHQAKDSFPKLDTEKGEIPPPEGLWIDGDGTIRLGIDLQTLKDYAALQDFLKFAGEDVVNELLAQAGVTGEEVNTLILSGRASMFWNIGQRVKDQFPKADLPLYFTDPNDLKGAVALGGLAKARMQEFLPTSAFTDRSKARLAAWLPEDGVLVWENGWDRIKEPRSPHMWIYQVNTVRPDITADLIQDSLRRNFYIPLHPDGIPIHRLRKGNQGDIYLRKFEEDGFFNIKIGNPDVAKAPILMGGRNATTDALSEPPWPTGRILLDPPPEEEDQS